MKAGASANGEKCEAAGGWLPGKLKDAEGALILKRRAKADLKGIHLDLKERPPVGVALSGGGIRSATFCLGLFQALARKGLVKQVDYLSTVSGGGYFGSFLGRMFTRDWVVKNDPQKQAVVLKNTGPSPCSHRNPEAEKFLARISKLEKLEKIPPKSPASMEDSGYEWVSKPVERVEAALADNTSPPLVWLRESGNYLTPYGSGDGLLSLGVYLRNWLAMLAVLLIVAFTWMAGFNVVRARLDHDSWMQSVEDYLKAQAGEQLWWSPAVLIPVAVAIVWLVPWAVAYWLTQRYVIIWISFGLTSLGCGALALAWSEATLTARTGLGILAVIFFLAILVATVFRIYAAVQAAWQKDTNTFGEMRGKLSDRLKRLTEHYAMVKRLTECCVVIKWLTKRYRIFWMSCGLAGVICVALAMYCSKTTVSAKMMQGILAAVFLLGMLIAAVIQTYADWQKGTCANSWMRKKLSDQLKLALVAVAGSFAFAVLDGWGQSIYATVAYAGSWQHAWPAISGVVGLTAVATLVRTLLLQGASKSKFKVPFQLMALGAALVIAVVLLTGLSVVNHGIAWRWQLAAPVSAWASGGSTNAAQSPGGKIYEYWCLEKNAVNLTDKRLIRVEPAKPAVHPADSCETTPDTHALAYVFALSVILCLCGGQTIGFLNLSSCHTLYSARLIRAYLGASSMKRWENAADITEMDSDDNTDWSKYAPHETGGPLHLINCALNCTESVESGAESTTAKGLNLCAGPVGLSYGQHHALFKPDFLAVTQEETDKTAVFMEPLSLGDWVGVSGAAFTTGLGNVGGPGGTTFGTSLLCGLFNVRLGYWWKNSFSPGDAINRMFPVQRYLLDEFTGSFHVLERDHWYLSDGGHFENTAAYELIRRRVPFIILADCGADPDGALDDLANLTRRIRVDFKAELTFLEQSEIDAMVGSPTYGIGTLEDLRLEKSFVGRPSADRAASAIQGVQDDDTGPLQARRVKRYATLAQVEYPREPDQKPGQEPEKTLILVIKPGLIGNEPSDLINYQRQEPEFPQQTTLDQFFDEAQWESYRKLGEHAMDSLLADGSWLRRKLS